jgi:predicted ATPase
LTTPARFGKNDADSQEIIPQTARTLREMLEQILFLDPNPSRMRDYSFIVNKTLQGDGANLSSVLYDLCENQGEKQAILAFIQALPEQDIRDVKFITTPRNEVMLQLTESFAQQERTWDAALLSDGTLRVLAIVAALLSAPKNAMVVIEEIDNGVHPSRARMLLENIQKIVRQRNLQVLLTTHNPALLDALPIAAVPDVVCCYRDPKQGDSRLIKLSDVRDYPELVSQGPVGTLMTRGVLDHYLKNPRSAAQKKKENLAWLENMKKSVEMK